MCCECNSFVVQAYLPSWCFVCSSFSECFGSEIKFYDGGRNDVGWVCPCRRVIRELHNSPANPVAVLEKSGQLFLPSSSSSVSSCDYRCTFCLFVCLFVCTERPRGRIIPATPICRTAFKLQPSPLTSSVMISYCYEIVESVTHSATELIKYTP